MKRLLIILMLAALVVPMSAQEAWTGTFATAPEFTGRGDMPQHSSLSGNTIRQIVKVTTAGKQLRVQLSNEFSDTPVEINGVYIALAKDTSDIDLKTVKWLKFAGKKNVSIPARQALYCDAFSYNLPKLTRLAVTICYGKNTPEHMTSHRGSRTNSYIAKGNVKPGKKYVTIEKLAHWYNIARIEVKAQKPAIAILGNSITDGRGSTTDAQNRWPDFMAEALNGEVGVLNLGIVGNCVVEGGLSEPALKRFDRDILGQNNVDKLIIFEGTNDIGTCGGNYEKKAKQVIDAYKVLIDKAHAKGIKVYGGTITPTKGNGWYSFFHEAMRQTINEWIRKPGNFDGIVDFDELVRDEKDPQKLIKEYSEDWLHLNPKGYEVMGKFAAKKISE